MRRDLALALTAAVGCGGQTLTAGDTDPSGGSSGMASGGETEGPPPWPTEVGPCALDPEMPRALVFTTTDFGTGAVSVFDLVRGQMTPDVAFASTDAIPFAHDDRLFVVNRYQWDYVDVLDPGAAWASLGEHPVSWDGVPSANPYGIAFHGSSIAFVPLFAAPAVAVLDLSLAPGDSQADAVSLAPFADADGNPEATNIVACGDAVFVTLERLDADAQLAPRDGDRIVAIDAVTRTRYGDELPVLGEFVKQLRRDPADPSAATVLALTTGIERIDLAAAEVEWALSEDVFEAAGLKHRWIPQSFDVDATGRTAYVAAYDPDFSGIRLYRAALDDPAAVLEELASGFDSVERTLEVVDDRLYYGSSRDGEPGLWIFDLSVEPPAILDGPISTGLPPYSMAVMP